MFPQVFEDTDNDVTVQDEVKSGLMCMTCGLPTYLIVVSNGPDDTDIEDVCIRCG